MRLAVIDIGTLTCRLLVASYIPGGVGDEASPAGSLDTVYTGHKMVWLGEGVDSHPTSSAGGHVARD